MKFCPSVLLQGVVVRHSNVDVELSSLLPANESEEQPSVEQDLETGSYELQDSEEPNDKDCVTSAGVRRCLPMMKESRRRLEPRGGQPGPIEWGAELMFTREFKPA
jgi:hypothetical protein